MHRKPDLAIRLADVNRICGYRDWMGPNCEVVVRNLNKRIVPLGYRAYEGNRATLKELLDILDDVDCSYPIIGLKQEYLVEEWGINMGEQRTTPDHTVTLLLQNDEMIGFHDPFEGRTQKMRQRNQGNGRGVVVLPTPRISAYWDDAREPSWFMWVKKERNVPRGQALIGEESGA